MLRKAFTLIELLVVIAIIAILAAILFPVFAQAKVAAKKTADLSNVKQIALATQMYLGDSDDNYPLQSGRDCGGLYDFNSRVFVPANWAADQNAMGCSKRVTGALQLANNTISPYMKNLAIWQMPGAPRTNSTDFNYASSNLATAYAEVSYNYNGVLSQYNATSVVDSAGTPVFWPAFGQIAIDGYTYAEPFLECPSPNAPCTFDGNGPNNGGDVSQCNEHDDHSSGKPNGQQSGIGNIHYTSWAFGKQQNWSFADGHAKSRPAGTGDPTKDPFPLAGYNSSGIPDTVAPYNTGYEAVFDQNCHMPLFRPDVTH